MLYRGVYLHHSRYCLSSIILSFLIIPFVCWRYFQFFQDSHSNFKKREKKSFFSSSFSSFSSSSSSFSSTSLLLSFFSFFFSFNFSSSSSALSSSSSAFSSSFSSSSSAFSSLPPSYYHLSSSSFFSFFNSQRSRAEPEARDPSEAINPAPLETTIHLDRLPWQRPTYCGILGRCLSACSRGLFLRLMMLVLLSYFHSVSFPTDFFFFLSFFVPSSSPPSSMYFPHFFSPSFFILFSYHV